MILRKVVAAFIVALVLSGSIARADCKIHGGDLVVLFGTSDDPDVFLWDSRFRMRQYEEGTFDEMNALLPHAVLARPGTRAVVESCVPQFVHSKYTSEPDDAIGVRILNGPLHGQGGWVLGSSVRNFYRHPIKKR